MRDLIGVYVGGPGKKREEIFLCFDWEQNDKENASAIKVRYGNRKFFTTGFKTKKEDSIILLRWKNDAEGHVYDIRKPELKRDGEILRMDLTKEYTAMGLDSGEEKEKAKRGGGSSHFYAYGNWIHIGEQGYYEAEHDSWGETHLNFHFAYPGLKIGNSTITKIEIATFDSVKGENMEPMYAFMRRVMDDLTAVKEYTTKGLKELFTKHFPETMYIEIWCMDKRLRASVDHKGEPRWRVCREDIVDGVKIQNTSWIANPKPLELITEELGL